MSAATAASSPVIAGSSQVFDTFFAGKQKPLSPRKFTSGPHTNDFGNIIKTLLVMFDTDRTSANMEALAKMYDFKLIRSKVTQLYPPRDHFICNKDGKWVLSTPPNDAKTMFDRMISLGLQYLNRPQCYHNHFLYFKKILGGSFPNVGVLDKPDHLAVCGQIKPLEKERAIFPFEGGNYFVVSHPHEKGRKLLHVGLDNFWVAFNKLRKDKTLEAIFKSEMEEVQKMVSPPTEAELLDSLNKMYAQGLILFDGKSGFIKPTDWMKTHIEISLSKSSENFETAARRKGLLKKLDAFPKGCDAKTSATKFFYQQAIVKNLIRKFFGLASLDDIILIPQLFYHLDLFIRPAPDGRLLIQDFGLCASLLREIKAKKDLLGLTKTDMDLLNGYLEMAESMEKSLKGLYDKTRAILLAAGYHDEDLIRTPGIFVDREDKKPPCINFMNGVTGYCEKTTSFFYIVMGAANGKLSKALMDAFASFMKSCDTKIEVKFIGYDPNNPSDFSEAATWQDRLGGVHCQTLELQTEPQN